MTLSDLISSDASDVFLNATEFAESTTFYPGGDPSQATTVTAVVVQDDLEGTREAPGDGVILERGHGTVIRESYKIECAASVDVDPTRRPHDLFKLADGTVVMVKRVLGRDAGMQTVWCTRRDDVVIRRRQKSG